MASVAVSVAVAAAVAAAPVVEVADTALSFWRLVLAFVVCAMIKGEETEVVEDGARATVEDIASKR